MIPIRVRCDTPHTNFETMLRHVPISDRKKDVLRDIMTGPERLYHGLYHLASMWRLHCDLSRIGSTPSYLGGAAHMMIGSAIAFHDAVYDPRSKTNEAESAKLWSAAYDGENTGETAQWTSRAGFAAAWVEQAILATADHLAERAIETDGDRLREWFVGLDLASLAVEPDEFDRNAALIRIEYRHLSDADWEQGRGSFARKMLDAPAIFRDPILHAHFEERARANLRRNLT